MKCRFRKRKELTTVFFSVTEPFTSFWRTNKRGEESLGWEMSWPVAVGQKIELVLSLSWEMQYLMGRLQEEYLPSGLSFIFYFFLLRSVGGLITHIYVLLSVYNSAVVCYIVLEVLEVSEMLNKFGKRKKQHPTLFHYNSSGLTYPLCKSIHVESVLPAQPRIQKFETILSIFLIQDSICV